MHMARTGGPRLRKDGEADKRVKPRHMWAGMPPLPSVTVYEPAVLDLGPCRSAEAATKITPEMIEAGHSAHCVYEGWDTRELVAEIYRAMLEVSAEQTKERAGSPKETGPP
jgi:hypothetical protein